MSNKSKSKTRQTVMEGDNQPYYHPVLEEQMIIRFPPDIAARLNASMEDENFEDFKIKFIDKHHAKVKLFGETLMADLVSLPTIVETHRTVDGSHLYKSADIGEILIVHRPNAVPDGISEDFVFEHGLTPPTLNIVSKRKMKQDAVRAQQSEQGSLDGIEYWEMVEIQLAALLSKEKSAKPICRQEFFEEPDIDPVTLEKILRRNGMDQYKGYSGTVIDDSEIDVLSPENEPVVHIPQEILSELQPGSPEDKSKEENEELIIDEIIEPASTPSPVEVDTDTSQAEDVEPKDEEESESESSEEEDEEEDDAISQQIASLQRQMKTSEVQLANYRRTIQNQVNVMMKEKYEKMITNLEQRIKGFDEQIKKLQSMKEEE